jgi:tRNA isopentenyl-2-thiomethyl-A-37 hydroxylase MiaE
MLPLCMKASFVFADYCHERSRVRFDPYQTMLHANLNYFYLTLFLSDDTKVYLVLVSTIVKVKYINREECSDLN